MKTYSKKTYVGILVAIVILVIAYTAVKYRNIILLHINSYTIIAKFNDIGGMTVGSPVYMVGIEIGRVADLTLDQENQLAVVELKIKNGIEIYDDAIAAIRSFGAYGEYKYVRIDAGGGGDLLENGDTITDTESPVDIMELISKYAFGGVNE